MALSLNAGTAYVSIRPDLRGFHTAIKADLQKLEKSFATAVSKGINQGVRNTSVSVGAFEKRLQLLDHPVPLFG